MRPFKKPVKCRYKNNESGEACDRPARKGWTMCDRHYTAGGPVRSRIKGVVGYGKKK